MFEKEYVFSFVLSEYRICHVIFLFTLMFQKGKSEERDREKSKSPSSSTKSSSSEKSPPDGPVRNDGDHKDNRKPPHRHQQQLPSPRNTDSGNTRDDAVVGGGMVTGNIDSSSGKQQSVQEGRTKSSSLSPSLNTSDMLSSNQGAILKQQQTISPEMSTAEQNAGERNKQQQQQLEDISTDFAPHIKEDIMAILDTDESITEDTASHVAAAAAAQITPEAARANQEAALAAQAAAVAAAQAQNNVDQGLPESHEDAFKWFYRYICYLFMVKVKVRVLSLDPKLTLTTSQFYLAGHWKWPHSYILSFTGSEFSVPQGLHFLSAPR